MAKMGICRIFEEDIMGNLIIKPLYSMDRDYPASLIHGQGWFGIGHLSHKSDLKKQGESTCL